MKTKIALLAFVALLLSPLPAFAAVKRVNTKRASTITVPASTVMIKAPAKYTSIAVPPKKEDYCKNLHVLEGKWEVYYGSEQLIATVTTKIENKTCVLSYSDNYNINFTVSGTKLPLLAKKAIEGYDVEIGYNEQKQQMTMLFSFATDYRYMTKI